MAWLGGSMGTELHLQGFGFGREGSVLMATGEEQTVATDNATIPTYQLEVEHMVDQIFLVTWSEGPASALQAKWRLVDMSPAGRE